MSLFEKIDKPKIYDNLIIKEEVNISRALELLNPKYGLSEEHLDKLKTYIGYKNRSLNDEYSNNGVIGRMYSKTSSQFLPSEIRATLFNECFDIDMKAAAPTIIKNLNDKLNLDCPLLSRYVQDRKKIIEDLSNKYENVDFKQLFNSILMGMGFNKMNEICKDQFILDFWVECQKWRITYNSLIIDDVYKYTDDKIKKLKEDGKKTKKDKVAGLIFDIENRILMKAYEYLKSIDIKVYTLIFDGLIADSNDFDIDELNKFILKETGFEIEFTFKEMENKYFDVLPKEKEFDFDIFYSFKTYEPAKAYFEEYYAVIDNPWCLINKMNVNDVKKYNVTQFKHNFNLKFKTFKKNRKGQEVEDKIAFWDLYNKDQKIAKYTGIDFLPPPLISKSKYTFNLFSEFAIEKVIDYDTKFSTKIYHEHMKHLVNYDDECYSYLVDFLADIVQNPGKKQDVCLIFKSGQGTGKNLFFESFGDVILGEQYRLTAENPDQVMGRFNGNHNKILVILDEMKAKKADSDCIKNLITAKNLNFEKKGLDMIQIKNLARYIILSNNDLPVKIEDTDRRFVLFETSNKYKGSIDTEYFETLAEALNNKHKMKVFYDELMNKVITTNFNKDRPITEQYKLLKELTGKDTIESFFDHYIDDGNAVSERKITKWYELFEIWMMENKISNFEVSQNAFTLRSKIKGLLKFSRKVKGERYYELTKPLFQFIEDN